MLDKNSKIYVAGHHGLVGSAIWENLKARGYNNLVGRTHQELDLTDQVAVKKFFDEERPDAVVLAAAFVGGIMANSLYRADFIMQNAALDESQARIKSAGRNISNLRYADNTALMAESEEELKSLLIRVKEESGEAGLKLNMRKN